MLQQSQNSAEGLDESWEVASLQSMLGVQRCCYLRSLKDGIIIISSSSSNSHTHQQKWKQAGKISVQSLYSRCWKGPPNLGCLPHANLPGSTSQTCILLVVHINQYNAQLWMFAVLE